MDEDYQLALLLQTELNNEGNGTPDVIYEPTGKGKENRRTNHNASQSLVDPQWEFIDPTPDIHVLFLQFNDRFFWGKLNGVEVKWSPRMTSCAGVCVYQGRAGFCSVRLSLPLLKLRPRKDLVETLLHEMIHAYLFVTKNNRDRDGHGPEFHKHMNRINQDAGTHISVYHSFHDEVKLYQQHWWRCNGPCQHRPPFFGMVRRSMNRAPGPYDNWWAQHEATCGGKFIKVKEPENTKGKKSSISKQKEPAQNGNSKRDIRTFFPGSSSNVTMEKSNAPSSSSSKGYSPANAGVPALKDISGNLPTNSSSTRQSDPFRRPVTSNVHSFGNGKNGESSSSVKPVANPATNNVFGFKDLNGGARSKPDGSNQPKGKGYVLGGKVKPPSQRAGGVSGGILANKGGGTLVVTGARRKDNDTTPSASMQNPAATQTASVSPFSGTGHTLGSGRTQRPNPFQRQIPVYTNDGNAKPSNYSKRASPPSEDIQRKKKYFNSDKDSEGASTNSKEEHVSCPACNKQILVSVINTHLDDCVIIDSEPANGSCTSIPKADVKCEDVILVSDSDDEESSEDSHYVSCPCCNKKVLKNSLDSHLSACVGNSFDDDIIALDTEVSGNDAKCPICGNSFPSADMDKHLDNCASCSIQDLSDVFGEDFSDEEEDAAVGSPSKRVSESGERVYPCPCCLILIETSKMNEHLDQCML